MGSEIDRSGNVGISSTHILSFFDECNAYINWHQQKESQKSVILPFGEFTDDICLKVDALKAKIDDFFLRCKIASFDNSSVDILNNLSSQLELLRNQSIVDTHELEKLPISKIEANKSLILDETVNPIWKNLLQQLFELIKNLDSEFNFQLTEDNWIQINNNLFTYINWKSEQVGKKVAELGAEKINNCLQTSLKEELLLLVEKDLSLKEQTDSIVLVEKLVRYYCHLHHILNNFVTFSDFYSPNNKGIFQAGVLYFDQRRCDLCIKVSDMNRHNTMASASGICLVYFDCFSKIKNEKMIILAAFTDGDIDNLTIGRNAIFSDNNGLDWDATIIKIIENPISIRQAFWSPYRKISKFISKQIEKLAASQEEKVNTATTSNIEKVSEKTETGLNQSLQPTESKVVEPNKPTTEPQKPAPFDIAKFAGIFAAIGLAFGAIGGVLASVVGGFLDLTWWKMPLAFLGIILAISGPSMILAWLKLRKRNLAPILDANGWAINAKITINIAFGTTLTHLAKLPKNSIVNIKDPFSIKQSPLLYIIIILAVLGIASYLLWHYGYFAKWGINYNI